MSRKWWLWVGVGVIALVPIQIGLRRMWPSIDDNDPSPGFELQLAAVAVLVLAALPHVVAVLGYRGRPWLLRVASVLAFIYTVISVISPFLLLAAVPLFLIPGVVYLVTSRRLPRYEQRISTGALIALAVVLGIGAAVSFMLTQDPRCTIQVRRGGTISYETPATCDPYDSGLLGPEVVSWSGSSDSVGWHESLLSLLLSGSLITLCLRSGTPEALGDDDVLAA